MSTTTNAPAKPKPETVIARQIAVAMQAGDWATVLPLATAARNEYPDAAPFGVTWDKMITHAKAQLGTATDAEPETVQAPEPQPEQAPKSRRRTSAPKTAQPRRAAQAEPVQEQATEPETVLPTLTMSHTVADGTRLLDSPDGEIGKKVSEIMGRHGARWMFHLAQKFWYVPGSKGHGADQVRMYNAATALKAAGFPVEWAVDDTDPATGETLPAHVAKAEQARRDAAYGERLTAIRWHLANADGVPCIEDGTMVAAGDARIVYERRAELPVVVCEAHVNGRELAQETVAVPVQASRTAAELDAVRVDVNALIVALQSGDASAAESLRAMLAPMQSVAPRAAKPRDRKVTVAPKAAAPKVDEALMGPQRAEVWYAVGTLPGGETAHVRKTAAALRSALTWGVANKHRKTGIEIHVYADRSARRLQITVSVTAVKPSEWVKIQDQVGAVALQVPGVAVVTDGE